MSVPFPVRDPLGLALLTAVRSQATAAADLVDLVRQAAPVIFGRERKRWGGEPFEAREVVLGVARTWIDLAQDLNTAAAEIVRILDDEGEKGKLAADIAAAEIEIRKDEFLREAEGGAGE